MIITDLEHLHYSIAADQVKGAAYTAAKAKASAHALGAWAEADAIAAGDSVSVRTTTQASFRSGQLINYSFAMAGSVAIARTGSNVSASVDYQVDAKVTKRR